MRLSFSLVLIITMIFAVSCSDSATKSTSEDSKLLAKGKRLYIYCQACHETTTAESLKLGPHLAGIMNRQVASLSNFTYSAALSQKDFVWDEENMTAWIKQPAKLVPGTTMVFAGLSDKEDIAALLAYLKTL